MPLPRPTLRRSWVLLLPLCVLSLAASAPAGRAQRSSAVPDAPAPQIRIAIATPPASPLSAAQAGAEPAPAGTISLYSVVDLALRNSQAVRTAEAAQQHARATMLEMRDAYIPNFSLGSGLGYSYGFPLGNPTLFNVNSTSLLFSFSQKYYIRAAAQGLKAATLSLKDVRQQIIQDAASTYIELASTLDQVRALQQAAQAGDNMVSVVQDRLTAGLAAPVDLVQARLTRAQLQLKAMQMEDHANELRVHLGNLTSLPPDTIDPSAASVPPMPPLDFSSVKKRNGDSPAVEASFATAKSRLDNAIGDKNQNYRPTVNMAAQYARFAPFNGYSNYYRNFSYNNIGVGIQAVWPLFDPIRRDKAIESKAEAARAQHQAELDKIRNSEANLSLWHSLQELKLQAQVAALEQQLAQDSLQAVLTRMNGAPGAAAAPVTPQQADQDRIDERARFVDMKAAQFNVIKTQLSLLAAVGGLEDWAKGAGASSNPASAVVQTHP
jgi:outer membrane protein TolC